MQLPSTTAVRIACEAIARTPLDQYVIWDGSAPRVRANSLPQRTLGCMAEVWTPVALRVLLQRATAECDLTAEKAERVRNAIRAHQGAQPAAYFLVRRTLAGDYLAVTDIPWPSGGGRPLRAGEMVLDAGGGRFGAAAPLSLAG